MNAGSFWITAFSRWISRSRSAGTSETASRWYCVGGGYSSGGSYSSGGYDRGPREMFSATCSNCGNEAKVPFRPTSGKPVYCSDCFRTMRG